MIGHADGELKFVTLDALKVEFIYKVQLQEGEELQAGCFSSFGQNFAIGTTKGAVYFGQFKKDVQTKNTVVRVEPLNFYKKNNYLSTNELTSNCNRS